MTVYVDEIRRYPSGQWCHMMSDEGMEELHTFAANIGLRRSWFQDHPSHPHYDLRPSKRRLALQNGATEIEGKELARMSLRKELRA